MYSLYLSNHDERAGVGALLKSDFGILMNEIMESMYVKVNSSMCYLPTNEWWCYLYVRMYCAIM